MSRENSLEDIKGASSSVASSMLLPPSMHGEEPESNVASSSTGSTVKGRRASKSVSGTRPGGLNLGQRTKSYHSPSASAAAVPTSAPMPSLLVTETKNPRLGLKRRISTPSIMLNRGEEQIEKTEETQGQTQVESRARSTSTSISIPPINAIAGPSSYQLPSIRYTADTPTTASQPTPPTTWAPIFVTPASPDEGETIPHQPYPFNSGRSRQSKRSAGILHTAYDLGESGISRLARWIRPSTIHRRRGSDEDSEKALDESEDISADSGGSVARTSEDSIRRNGKYWGKWGNGEGENEEEGYFSLPPTPPEEKPETSLAQFETALRESRPGVGASLPTPALSTRSLSRSSSKRRARATTGEDRDGWLATVVNLWSNLGGSNSPRTGKKTAEVLRELGWTVALLVGLFVVTAAMVAFLIQGMPM